MEKELLSKHIYQFMLDNLCDGDPDGVNSFHNITDEHFKEFSKDMAEHLVKVMESPNTLIIVDKYKVTTNGE